MNWLALLEYSSGEELVGKAWQIPWGAVGWRRGGQRWCSIWTRKRTVGRRGERGPLSISDSAVRWVPGWSKCRCPAGDCIESLLQQRRVHSSRGSGEAGEPVLLPPPLLSSVRFWTTAFVYPKSLFPTPPSAAFHIRHSLQSHRMMVQSHGQFIFCRELDSSCYSKCSLFSYF